jgi:CDP-4-dehydro-6-deoxyglucose reductase, E1
MKSGFNYNLAEDSWDHNEIEAIQKVIESNRFTMGNKVKEFEINFARFVGAKYAVMSNSGSSANLLAIASLFHSNMLVPGDEVIVPAVSWSTTYYPLTQYGLIPVFVDIDLSTLNLSINEIEYAISNKTKAIFAVNLLGNPNDFRELNRICSENNLFLIEDNCESLGAVYDNKQTGTFGLIGTYSTYYSHHISTMEGGLSVTNSKSLYDIMISLRAHGWTRDLDSNTSIYSKKKDPFYESFNFVLPGYNLRPLEFEGAIGIEQVKKLPRIISQRRENAKYFVRAINNLVNYSTQIEIGESSWFGFPIILNGILQGKRSQLVNKLSTSGIETRPIVAGNFTLNPVIQMIPNRVSGTLNNANYIHENGLFVGNHSVPNFDKIDLLICVLKEFEVEQS